MLSPSASALDSALTALLDSIGSIGSWTQVDTAEFSVIDTLSDALRSSREAFDLHIRNIEAKINKRRNALLPIHQLPVEILAEIFRSSSPQDLAMPARHNLAQVCNTWLQIVLGTPRLWTRFQTDCASWPMVLRKSFDLPLAVHFGSYYDDTYTEAWDQVARLRHRWKSILILSHVDHGVSRANRLLEGTDIPLLEAIRFTGEQVGELGIIPLAPKLHSITTTGPFFHWPVMPPQPQLRTIRMYHMSISLDQLTGFFTMLTACPLIENLRFQGVSVPGEVSFLGGHATTGSLVALPNLARVLIENSPTLFAKLLWHVKAGDALLRVVILQEDPFDFSHLVGLYISQQSPTSILRKALEPSQSAYIDLDLGRRKLALHSAKSAAASAVSVDLTAAHSRQLPFLLEINRPPGPALTVRVLNHPSEPQDDAQLPWSALLRSMGLAETLVLGARQCTSWLSELWPKQRSNDFEGPQWPAPVLRRLVLELGEQTGTADELNGIKDLLTCRKSTVDAEGKPVFVEMEVWDRKGRQFDISEGRFVNRNADELPLWWRDV